MKSLYSKQYYLNCKNFQLKRYRARLVADEIMKLRPKRVLDVGCGLGTLVRVLREERGIEAIGVDFAQTLKDDFGLDKSYFMVADAKKLPFKDKSFDVVVSTDFFEHLPEQEIDIVANEMKRVGKVVLAKVAYEAVLNSRQRQLHLTNKAKEWWRVKLKDILLI